MVLLGCGSVALGFSHIAVSAMFGIGVFCAIMIFQPISGAHINPAVSIAFAAKGDLEQMHYQDTSLLSVWEVGLLQWL